MLEYWWARKRKPSDVLNVEIVTCDNTRLSSDLLIIVRYATYVAEFFNKGLRGMLDLLTFNLYFDQQFYVFKLSDRIWP